MLAVLGRDRIVQGAARRGRRWRRPLRDLPRRSRCCGGRLAWPPSARGGARAGAETAAAAGGCRAGVADRGRRDGRGDAVRALGALAGAEADEGCGGGLAEAKQNSDALAASKQETHRGECAGRQVLRPQQRRTPASGGGREHAAAGWARQLEFANQKAESATRSAQQSQQVAEQETTTATNALKQSQQHLTAPEKATTRANERGAHEGGDTAGRPAEAHSPRPRRTLPPPKRSFPSTLSSAFVVALAAAARLPRAAVPAPPRLARRDEPATCRRRRLPSDPRNALSADGKQFVAAAEGNPRRRAVRRRVGEVAPSARDRRST